MSHTLCTDRDGSDEQLHFPVEISDGFEIHPNSSTWDGIECRRLSIVPVLRGSLYAQSILSPPTHKLPNMFLPRHHTHRANPKGPPDAQQKPKMSSLDNVHAIQPKKKKPKVVNTMLTCLSPPPLPAASLPLVLSVEIRQRHPMHSRRPLILVRSLLLQGLDVARVGVMARTWLVKGRVVVVASAVVAAAVLAPLVTAEGSLVGALVFAGGGRGMTRFGGVVIVSVCVVHRVCDWR